MNAVRVCVLSEPSDIDEYSENRHGQMVVDTLTRVWDETIDDEMTHS